VPCSYCPGWNGIRGNLYKRGLKNTKTYYSTKVLCMSPDAGVAFVVKSSSIHYIDIPFVSSEKSLLNQGVRAGMMAILHTEYGSFAYSI
jgi:hypothetical protein